jgi:hypothetical protein
MKKLMMTALALSLFSAPAFAGGSGGANAAAGANAGAQASATSGDARIDSFGAASIGGAYCADGAVLGPVGLTKSRRSCEIAQTATTAFDRGVLSPAEYRALMLHSLDKSGARLRYNYPQAEPVVSSMSASMAATAETATYRVDRCELVDGKIHIRHIAGANDAYKAAATQACKAELGF